MKHLKKVMALVIATVMMISMTAAVFASDITIKQAKNDRAQHTYGAYQIFKGTVKEEGGTKTLENIEWGASVTDKAALATALNDLRTTGDEFANLTAESIPAAFAAAINKLAGSDNDTARAQKIADAVAGAVSQASPFKEATSVAPYESVTIEDLPDGYYLVQDKVAPTITTSENSGAFTRYILEVVGDDLNVDEKADAPSVDKQVQDQNEEGEREVGTVAGDDGWGETADHAINESFKFKLIATIPANEKTNVEDFKAPYVATFEDTLSAGVTYEGIEKVVITTAEGAANETVEAYNVSTNPKGYILDTTAISADGGGKFTIKIPDLRDFIDTNPEKGKDIVITVIYNAHLNKNAVCYDSDQTNANDNQNKVTLKYSNNPNATAAGEPEGETKEDYVFVFTYNVDNTKYSETIDPTHLLKGAGFTLYKNTVAAGNEVKLVLDGGKYRPATEAEITTAGANAKWEMTSQEDGTFNIIGLDYGTYKLSETTTPAGYNTVADRDIVIQPTHKENEQTTGGILTFTGTQTTNMKNSIENKTGTVLPSTGGIGTTLFYIIGSVLVLGAGVLLITRKRMSAN